MKKLKNNIFNYFIIFNLFNILLFSCSDSSNSNRNNCLPRVSIDAVINLNLPQYQNLINTGGYVETTNISGHGTRGLIIVRKIGNEFIIYDRNAPHICPDNNTTLLVEDDFLIVCKKDNSKWNLLTGEPLAVTNKPPIIYTSYNFISSSNTLIIKNL